MENIEQGERYDKKTFPERIGDTNGLGQHHVFSKVEYPTDAEALS
ncbi:MAG: hypothetical protein NVS9B9_20250 [Ktedonobacteraceae bacterium]